jgi:antitoxin MazE
MIMGYTIYIQEVPDMRVTLSKWGNSAGIRIPAAFQEELGFHAGDELEIKIENKELIISKPAETAKDVIEQFYQKPYEDVVRMNVRDDELDWGEDVGDEVLK